MQAVSLCWCFHGNKISEMEPAHAQGGFQQRGGTESIILQKASHGRFSVTVQTLFVYLKMQSIPFLVKVVSSSRGLLS